MSGIGWVCGVVVLPGLVHEPMRQIKNQIGIFLISTHKISKTHCVVKHCGCVTALMPYFADSFWMIGIAELNAGRAMGSVRLPVVLSQFMPRVCSIARTPRTKAVSTASMNW